MTPVLVFDIETVPDAAALRAIHGLDPAMDERDVAEIAFQRRRAAVGHDFLPVHVHRVVALSLAMRDDSGFRVWTLGRDGEDEHSIVQRFFDGLDRFTPQLVSWNGGGFDLPVLHYRALAHGVSAPRYWDQGEEDRDFKWNNYLGRYHARHVDLMDLLALYQARNNVPLDQASRLLGLPGKLGMDGSQVFAAWREGRINDICDYCETDVLNTWLIWLRFQLMRGHLDASAHAAEVSLVRSAIEAADTAHWREYLSAWDASTHRVGV
jgi:predicted PolB exonuclease-like 3'-5' exonuclease